MKKMELIAPCHFGLEAVLKREILDLGYDITEGSVSGETQRQSAVRIYFSEQRREFF